MRPDSRPGFRLLYAPDSASAGGPNVLKDDKAGNLDTLIDNWRNAYERLANISERQYMLVKDVVAAAISGSGSPEEHDPKPWQEMGRLTEEKEALQQRIEQLQAELRACLGPEELQALFHREIATIAEGARVLTMEAAAKVEQVMLATGTQIGATRLYRKAMHAYYGINRDDRAAFYIDEKK